MIVSLRRAALVWIPGMAVAALLVSCGRESRSGAPRSAVPPKEIELVPAQLRPMERIVTVTGTLAARERSVLSAKVSGRLQQVNVDIGSTVAKGDLVAQIEPRDFELGLQEAVAALAQARAALGLEPEGDTDEIKPEDASGVKQARAVLQEATNNRERIQTLAKSGIASQSEVDTAEAGYTVASTRHDAALEEARSRIATVAQRRAELEIAKKQLSDTAIRAPFAGKVQSRPAGLGQFVGAGTAIAELVQTDPLRLRLNVPERYATKVRLGQQARLLAEGDTNRYTAQITRLSPALDEQSRMLLVEADVPARESLRPGLFARAELVISENEQGLAVPLTAVTTFAGLEKVVVARDGKAVEKPVQTGRHGHDWVEIVSGLAAGDPVVLNPVGLRTGTPVTVGRSTGTQPASREDAGAPGAGRDAGAPGGNAS